MKRIIVMANELDAREELAPLVAIARKDAEIIRPDYGGPRIYVFLQPENKYYYRHSIWKRKAPWLRAATNF